LYGLRKEIIDKLEGKINQVDHKFSIETAKLNTMIENEIGMIDDDEEILSSDEEEMER
jgi:hypothetical protein